MAAGTGRDVRPDGDPDRKARRAEVRAIAPSTLLVLDEARFRQLLERSPALQEAVRESAEKRGIEPDLLLSDTPARAK